jgi:hypothetical protein
MTIPDADGDGPTISIAVSAIEIEVLDVLRSVVIRNPPADLARAGVRDGATWCRYGDENGYDFFDQLLKGERALPVGKIETWIFADGNEEICIRGTLIADEVAPSENAAPPAGAKAPTDDADALTLAELVAASYGEAPIAPTRTPLPAATADLTSGRPSLETPPRSQLPDTPVEPSPAPIDFRQLLTPEKVWADYQRMRRSAEPATALGPGGGYACGGDYKPFAS